MNSKISIFCFISSFHFPSFFLFSFFRELTILSPEFMGGRVIVLRLNYRIDFLCEIIRVKLYGHTIHISHYQGFRSRFKLNYTVVRCVVLVL